MTGAFLYQAWFCFVLFFSSLNFQSFPQLPSQLVGQSQACLRWLGQGWCTQAAPAVRAQRALLPPSRLCASQEGHPPGLPRGRHPCFPSQPTESLYGFLICLLVLPTNSRHMIENVCFDASGMCLAPWGQMPGVLEEHSASQ